MPNTCPWLHRVFGYRAIFLVQEILKVWFIKDRKGRLIRGFFPDKVPQRALKRAWGLGAVTALLSTPTYGDPAPCNKVRMADVGWTDITVTTAVISEILQRSGYTASTTQLSVPVTFRALAEGDMDLFLGNWMPTMAADIKPYVEKDSIEILHPILRGARFTLAVPAYVAEQGVQSFSDLAPFKERFQGKIYGIEPGNDGNRIIQRIIASNAFGLGDWTLVESSEQGMLAQALHATSQKDWMVFLAWAPHPMNTKMHLRYLRDGDAHFGPEFGRAEVLINTRKGLSQECPTLGRFLQKIEFTLEDVNDLMGMVLDQKLTPAEAASQWLEAHADRWSSWGLKASALPPQNTSERQVITETPPSRSLGTWIHRGLEFILEKADRRLHRGSQKVGAMIHAGVAWLMTQTPWSIIVALSLMVWGLRRSLVPVLYVSGGLGLVLWLGYWKETLETLTLVLLSTSLALLGGIPLGIACAKSRLFNQGLRPVLDLMQTLPTFVYLIPALMFFGLGVTPGLVATLIFVLPLPIRLTSLGISRVPRPLHELGLAFGASAWQRLWKIELPYAWPTIRTAISQSMILSLSMVVIAALVGADGLGKPVIQALNTIDVAKGFDAGLAIVVVAVMLDRMVHSSQVEELY